LFDGQNTAANLVRRKITRKIDQDMMDYWSKKCMLDEDNQITAAPAAAD